MWEGWKCLEVVEVCGRSKVYGWWEPVCASIYSVQVFAHVHCVCCVFCVYVRVVCVFVCVVSGCVCVVCVFVCCVLCEGVMCVFVCCVCVFCVCV